MQFLWVWLLMFLLYVRNSTAVINPANNYPILRVAVGERFSLRCTLGGNESGVAWLYNNIPLQQSREVYYENEVLTISVMREEYQGWYTCTAGTLLDYQERDYLLIAVDDDANSELISIPQQFEYSVLDGSQVELPCIALRSPIWRYNGTDVRNDMRFTVVNVTGSLIIKNFTSDLFSGSFQCDDNPNSTYSVTVIKSNGTDSEIISALHLLMDDDYIVRNRMLSCARFINEEEQMFVIRWTKNLKDLSSYNNNNNSNSITVTSSGFYCCQLRKTTESSYLYTFCATVLISDVVLPSSVSLPANRVRIISLLCHVFPGSRIYDEYHVTMMGNISLGSLYVESTDFVFNQTQADVPMSSSEIICTVESRRNITESRSQASVHIGVVELSNYNNLLQGHTGDFSNSSHFSAIWHAQDSGYDTIYGETVLYVNSTFDGLGQLSQHVRLPPFSSSISVSGRVRQEFTSRPAAILISYRSGAFSISNPFPESKAWQWISGETLLCREFGYWECIIGVKVTVNLTVFGVNIPPNEVAYFDNLKLSTSLDLVLVIVTAGIGTVLVILVLLTCSLVCICCHLCIRRMKRKSNVAGKRNAGLADKDLQHELITTLTQHRTESDVPLVQVISGVELCILPSHQDLASGKSLLDPEYEYIGSRQQDTPETENMTATEIARGHSDSLTSQEYINVSSLGIQKTQKKLDSSLGIQNTQDSGMCTAEKAKTDFQFETKSDDNSSTRERSSSLTSQGYVDVASLDIHSPNKKEDSIVHDMTVVGNSKLGIESNEQAGSGISRPRERSDSITSQGYVDVKSLDINKKSLNSDRSLHKKQSDAAQSCCENYNQYAIYEEPSPVMHNGTSGDDVSDHNARSSKKDRFIYHDHYSIATDGIPASSINRDKERSSIGTSSVSVSHPRKKAHSVNLSELSHIRPKHNNANAAVLKPRSTYIEHFQDMIYTEPNRSQLATNDGYASIGGANSTNERVPSKRSQQPPGSKMNKDSKEQRERSNSITSQGYVDVTSPACDQDSDEEYCYINPKNLSPFPM